MSIVSRAMKMTDLKSDLRENELNTFSFEYNDYFEASEWSKKVLLLV